MPEAQSTYIDTTKPQVSPSSPTTASPLCQESWWTALRSLRDQIDTSTSTGRFFFTVTAAISQLEADLTRERTLAGLEAAAAAGVQLGRPTTVTPDQARLILQLVHGGMSHRKVAASLRLSRAVVGRVVRGEIASLGHVTHGDGADLLDPDPAPEGRAS